MERKTIIARQQFQTVQANPQVRADSPLKDKPTALGRYKTLVNGGVLDQQNDVTSNMYQDDRNNDSNEEYKDQQELGLNRQMTNDHDSPRKNTLQKSYGLAQNQLNDIININKYGNSKTKDTNQFKESQDTFGNDVLANSHKRYKTIMIQQTSKNEEGRSNLILDKESDRDSNFQNIVVVNEESVKLAHNRRNYNENL